MSVAVQPAIDEVNSRYAAASHGWEWGALREYLRDLAGLEPESANGGTIRISDNLKSTDAGRTTIVKGVGSDFDFCCFRASGIFTYNEATGSAAAAAVGGYVHNLYERAYVLQQNYLMKVTLLDTRLSMLGDRKSTRLNSSH